MDIDEAAALLKELTAKEPNMTQQDLIPYIFEMISVLNDRVKELESE